MLYGMVRVLVKSSSIGFGGGGIVPLIVGPAVGLHPRSPSNVRVDHHSAVRYE